MNKGFSFFYAAVFTGALVCSACNPDANDPSVNFVIENQSSYDLYRVTLANEGFVTAGEECLRKKTPSVGVRLAPETGRRITFTREGGSDLWEIATPITISLRDDRFVIEDKTMVTQGGGESYALSELIATPSNVRVEVLSSTGIKVSWSAVAVGARYTVSRSTGSDGPYTQIETTTPITGTSYTDTGLEAGVTYYYKVTAHSADGKRTSGASAPVSGATKPAAPLSVTVIAQSSSGITVSWNAVTGASSYLIYRATGGDGPYTQIETTTPITGTSYTDTGLQADTPYYYKVAASNAGGTGEQSEAKSARTNKVPPVAAATAMSSKRITVSWNAVTGALSYRIYRATGSDGPYTQIGGDTPITGISYTDTGLEPNTQYYYKVSAVYSGEEGAQSETAASAKTQALPSAPSGITAVEASTTSVNVSWIAASDATTYKIYYGTAANTVTTVAGSTAAGATNYTVTGLSSGTQYYFAVSSLDSDNEEGAKSTAEVTATPGNPNTTIHISLRPTSEDPPLANASLSATSVTEFSAGSEYDSYAWYWNGVVIAEATSSSYTLTASSKTPGIYELSVAVTRGGKQLSARCRVTITAY